MATHCEAWQASRAVGRLFVSQGDFRYFLLLQGPHIEKEQSIVPSFNSLDAPYPIAARVWAEDMTPAPDWDLCLQLLLPLLTCKSRACLKCKGPVQVDQSISQC